MKKKSPSSIERENRRYRIFIEERSREQLQNLVDENLPLLSELETEIQELRDLAQEQEFQFEEEDEEIYLEDLEETLEELFQLEEMYHDLSFQIENALRLLR